MTGAAFSSWLTLGRGLSAKSALLLLTAWALTLAMRRSSAAARHLVWLLAFAGLLALPLLSVTLPQHPVPVLPQPAAPLALPPAPVPPDTVPVAPSAPPRPVHFTPARARLSAPPDWPRLFGLLWLGGVAVTILPLGAGWLLAARRIRHCLPVTDPAVIALAADARRQIGVPRPVALRSGPGIAVPVTLGLFRPVVLLPEAAHAWPAERLRVALLHEFAHIRRGDWAAQTGARLVCALYWHNPLVWAAARLLRAEAERACDDLVLAAGVPAPDYARHLLAVAQALSGRPRPLPLAVPMAGCGPLESRLRAVLAARPRRAPSRRLAATALLLALGVLVPLATLRPAARAADGSARPFGRCAPAVGHPAIAASRARPVSDAIESDSAFARAAARTRSTDPISTHTQRSSAHETAHAHQDRRPGRTRRRSRAARRPSQTDRAGQARPHADTRQHTAD